MPKSKRNKVVHLTQVKKKGKDHKDDLKKQVEQYINQFQRVYLFDFEQTKSDRIMNLRLKLKEHGRIFAGRNSIVTTALKSVGTDMKVDFEHLVKHLKGHKGLLFTDLKQTKLIGLLEDENPEFKDKLQGYAQLDSKDSDGVIKFRKL